MTIPFSITGGSNHLPYGSITFTTEGLNTWVVPVGVTSISAVVVGGGGGSVLGGGGGAALAYVNNASVTPGETLSVYVGGAGFESVGGGISSIRTSNGTTLVAAAGGQPGGVSAGGAGGTVLTGTGFAGGSGGNAGPNSRPGGGGGAGGYSGVGGNGSSGANNPANGGAGTGGSGGGGRGSNSNAADGEDGGGVGVDIGLGLNGLGGTGLGVGLNGSVDLLEIFLPYGGGARGGSGGIGKNGQPGVVKILWNYPTFGSPRLFPSTDVIDSYDFAPYFISATTSNTNTISIPTFINPGDIGILFDTANNTTTTIPTTVVPSGWTTIDNASFSGPSSVRSIISYKSLIANDSGQTLTGMNDTTDSKILLIVRTNGVYNQKSLSFDVTLTGSEATNGADPTSQLIARTKPLKDSMIYIANYRSDVEVVAGGAGGLSGQTSNGLTHVVKYGDVPSSSQFYIAPLSSMTTTGQILPSFQVLQSAAIVISIV